MDDASGRDQVALVEREVSALIGRVAERGATTGWSLTPDEVKTASRWRRPRWHPTPRRAAWMIAAVAAAVVALLVVVNPLHNGSPGGGRSAAQPGTVGASTFHVVGGGPQSANLLCVTATVCYASETSDGGSLAGITGERTTNGGRSWTPLAPLPVHALLTWPLSCPTTRICYGAVAGIDVGVPSELAFTADGGRHWRIIVIPVPPLSEVTGKAQSSISGPSTSSLSCPTERECVAYLTGSVTGSPVGYFMTTRNGGKSWRLGTVHGFTLATNLSALDCDATGRCVSVVPQGLVAHPATGKLETVRSNDFGRTWTASSVPFEISPGVLLASCGDATHCLVTYGVGSGRAVGVARTADAGRKWAMTTERSWPEIATYVSCATGNDCFIAVAQPSTTLGYTDPLIEASHDGGAHWKALALPATVAGSPLVIVYPLSCPVPGGCIGIGATLAQFRPSRAVIPPGGPPLNGNRIMISNLGGGGS